MPEGHARADEPRILRERKAFARRDDLVADLAAGRMPARPATWAEVEPSGRTAGRPTGNVVAVHLRDALWRPATGALILPDGRAPEAAALGAEASGADLARLRAAAAAEERAAGFVWMNAGARRNFGHFLFDALPALAWADGAGVLRHLPPVAPPLARWQRDLVAMLGPSRPVEEVAAPAVRLRDAGLTTALNHYLHRGGELVDGLARRLAAAGPPARPEGVVYLSRRGTTGRVMVNEAALEAALAARGARVIDPGRLTVAEQVAAARSARVLVGPSGAALASLLFLAPGARVVEIRPAPVDEPWIAIAAARLGLDHRVVPAGGPLPRRAVPWRDRLRQAPRLLLGRYRYAFACEVEAVLDAVG